MARQKSEKYVELKPKTDNGKRRLSYHGERWIFRGEKEKLNFVREAGPWLICRSRDGVAILHVKKSNDIDFDVRLLF